MKKRFAHLLLPALIFLITSCDYKVQLVESPDIKINKMLIGQWTRLDNEQNKDSLLILPLNKYEYFISFPNGTNNSMFAKACFFDESGVKLVQLTWIGNIKGETVKDGRCYQYAKFSLNNKTLTVSLLSTNTIRKNINSKEKFLEQLEKNKKNPNLFEKPMIFQK